MIRIAKARDRKEKHESSVGRYDYSGLCHWWAYNYGSKSTASNKMHASGNSIYSYETIVATMYDTPKSNTRTVLISDYSYSNTTRTHVSEIRKAVSHMNIIYASEASPRNRKDHISNLLVMVNRQYRLASLYQKKKKDSTRNQVLNSMKSNLLNAEKYATAFKIRNSKEYNQLKSIPLPDSDMFSEKLEISIKDRMSAENRAHKANVRKAAKLHKDRLAKALAGLERWKNGDNVYVDNRFIEQVYLRVKNGVIETSENASMNVKEAVSAYSRFKEGKLKIGQHVGEFSYNGVDSDENVHIGCHTIPLEEVERLMNTMKKD